MPSGEMVLWLNGSYLPLSRAGISPLDRGLLFGDGIFTTLRAQDGRPLHLREHLQRLTASARALNLPPDLGQAGGLRQAGGLGQAGGPDWPEIIAGLLERNSLLRGPARIKLLLTRGPAPGPGLPQAVRPTFMALAEPYQPPSQAEYASGWRLTVCREGHAPPLAGHKTLNYLYHLLARQRALEAGCHEAVILGPGGELCETSAGSLLVRSDGQWWTPESPFLLPGVTINLVSALLADMGQPVLKRPARPEDLWRAETVWVLGSLMGAMPVAEVDGRALPATLADRAALARRGLFA